MCWCNMSRHAQYRSEYLCTQQQTSKVKCYGNVPNIHEYVLIYHLHFTCFIKHIHFHGIENQQQCSQSEFYVLFCKPKTSIQNYNFSVTNITPWCFEAI
jgi:hypothetical protein